MAKAKPDRKGKAPKPKAKAKSAEPKKNGRPHGYNEAIGQKICDLVAQRVSVAKICAMDGLPSKDTLYRWKREIPEFSDLYARAREHRADARSDYIEDVLEDTKAGRIDPAVARLVIDTEKWLMAKEKPRSYGDKLALTDPDGGKLVIEIAA